MKLATFLTILALASAGRAEAVHELGQERAEGRCGGSATVVEGLGVGDPAPRLRVGGWLKGEPIAAFEPGSVYVVEFWSTWCLPCEKSIPLLSTLQARHAERGVRVVGVSVFEDRACEVAHYVARQGERMNYTVASDALLEGATSAQGAMVLSWLKPSGEISLPTAFLVDGSGVIVWIGETHSLEQPLEQVLAGTWDLAQAKLEHQKRVRVRSLRATLNAHVREKLWEKALETIEEMRTLDPLTEARTAAWRFTALLNLGRDEEAWAYGRAALEGLLKDDALALNVIAWTVVDPRAPARASRDLDFALAAAERATELTERRNAAILDTLAVVQFERGSVALAIATEEEALALAAGVHWAAELRERLELFRRALRTPSGGRLASR
ncbi:MAG: redoxin domain-containing protein [Planctomycetes bacterium]|nr:redoxin domain-containing protein [Planctomycetota bacterium]